MLVMASSSFMTITQPHAWFDAVRMLSSFLWHHAQCVMSVQKPVQTWSKTCGMLLQGLHQRPFQQDPCLQHPHELPHLASCQQTRALKHPCLRDLLWLPRCRQECCPQTMRSLPCPCQEVELPQQAPPRCLAAYVEP